MGRAHRRVSCHRAPLRRAARIRSRPAWTASATAPASRAESPARRPWPPAPRPTGRRRCRPHDRPTRPRRGAASPGRRSSGRCAGRRRSPRRGRAACRRHGRRRRRSRRGRRARRRGRRRHRAPRRADLPRSRPPHGTPASPSRRGARRWPRAPSTRMGSRRSGTECPRCHGGMRAECRGVPQSFELVVHPEQRHRDAGHVEARHELAAQGAHHLDASGREQVAEIAEQHEELFVLHRAEPVDDQHRSCGGALRPLGQQRLEECLREFGSPLQRHVAHAGLAVDAQADRHHPLGNREQRRGGTRERAAGEGDAEAPGAAVRVHRDPLHLVEVGALLGSGARDAEHAQVAGDAAPRAERIRRRTRDVVGHQHRAHIDARVAQLTLGRSEVDHVARVVAVAVQDAAARVDLERDAHRLTGRRGGEDVAAHRTGCHAGTDQSGERRVVP